MINYVVTYAHRYTILRYLRDWGKDLRAQFRVLSYEQLPSMQLLPSGTYVFSDLERLSARQLRFAASIAATIRQSGMKILNDPRCALSRYQLLKKLNESRINDFSVYRVGEQPSRFPVFLRLENDHNGSLSQLLYSQAELDQSVASLVEQGIDPATLMTVEHLNVIGRDRLFRKYSCFLIGDCFIPRHLLFSHNWVTKKPDVINDAVAQEEAEFLFQDPHPHESEIRAVFKIAKLDYGRIDYGVFQDKIQVWEINTNPIITIAPEKLAPLRFTAQERIAHQVGAAFCKINDALSTVTLHMSSNCPGGAPDLRSGSLIRLY